MRKINKKECECCGNVKYGTSEYFCNFCNKKVEEKEFYYPGNCFIIKEGFSYVELHFCSMKHLKEYYKTHELIDEKIELKIPRDLIKEFLKSIK